MPTFYIFIGNIDSRMVVLKVPGRTVVNPESYETWLHVHNLEDADSLIKPYLSNNNNRRLVTLAEHTSDHGRQTNSSTEEKGEQV